MQQIRGRKNKNQMENGKKIENYAAERKYLYELPIAGCDFFGVFFLLQVFFWALTFDNNVAKMLIRRTADHRANDREEAAALALPAAAVAAVGVAVASACGCSYCAAREKQYLWQTNFHIDSKRRREYCHFFFGSNYCCCCCCWRTQRQRCHKSAATIGGMCEYAAAI